jgi:uncharacterized protein DUF4399
MAVSKPREFLSQTLIFPIFVLMLLAGLITYAVVLGSGGSASPAASHVAQRTPLATGVAFVSPLDGDTVTNPVSAHMAIAGIRYQRQGEPVQAGYGHLGVVVDGAVPSAGATFTADPTHIDLSDGSYVTTLPTLSPGSHTLTVVWANANEVISAPLLADTIHITVTPPVTAAPTG